MLAGVGIISGANADGVEVVGVSIGSVTFVKRHALEV